MSNSLNNAKAVSKQQVTAKSIKMEATRQRPQATQRKQMQRIEESKSIDESRDSGEDDEEEGEEDSYEEEKPIDNYSKQDKIIKKPQLKKQLTEKQEAELLTLKTKEKQLNSMLYFVKTQLWVLEQQGYGEVAQNRIGLKQKPFIEGETKIKSEEFMMYLKEMNKIKSKLTFVTHKIDYLA